MRVVSPQESTSGILWHGFCKVPFFKISENFQRCITVIPFIQEVLTLLKMNYLESYIELTFSSKDNFSCVTDNVYTWMPMPMPMPIPTCRDFQMAFNRFFVDNLLGQTFKRLLLNILGINWKSSEIKYSLSAIFRVVKILAKLATTWKMLNGCLLWSCVTFF